jgi:hypothetical protein
VIGEEVIRRYCKWPKDADDQALRAETKTAVKDEGYEADPAQISVRR